MDAAPELLEGRYELGPVLGRGGMGEVRAATDRRLGRQVAVKLLHPALDESARRRFEDEARAAAQLVHPNVVGVFDTGEHDGTPFIVMECLPGRTLADEIAEGPLPVDRARAVAHQILAALEAAHGAGVLHRDIKPGNVLLGPDGLVKVADFGIAKTAEGSDHTATGMVIGTPSYLAPERIMGRPATAQSDLYAVGVVLHEALTGTRPFAGMSPVAAAETAATQAPPPLGATVRSADPALAATVERALAISPDDRFASASEMRAAIGGGAGATSPEPATVVRPAVAPTEVQPALASTRERVRGSGAARVAGATSERAVGPGAPGTAPSAARPRPRRQRTPVLAGLVTALLLVVLLVLLAGRGDGGDERPVEVDAPAQPALPEQLEGPVRALEEAVQP